MGIEQELRQVLLQLWMLPWGTVTNYHQNGAHGIARSCEPPGTRLDGPSELLPHEYWGDQWDRALGPLRKQAVLEGARAELSTWRKTPVVVTGGETRDELEARMIRDGEGWPIDDVARNFKCLPKRVRDVRRRHGVAVETGKIPVVKHSLGEQERARDLAANGMTERQIRMIMGCGGSKLQRLLGKAV